MRTARPTTWRCSSAARAARRPECAPFRRFATRSSRPGYADLLDNADGFSPPAARAAGSPGTAAPIRSPSRRGFRCLSPFEMANATPAAMVARLRVSALGSGVRAGVRRRRRWPTSTSRSPSSSSPCKPSSSRIRAFIRTAASTISTSTSKPGGELTPPRPRGLEVFNDPKTGNCFGCHFSDASQDDGAPAQLTDFSFEAIGVPRNPQIPANRDRRYTDLGVCGPLRDDHVRFTEFCGLFKTPTLRNVATRRAFFHNGVIHSLEQAVRFYNTRDTRPELWYPTVGGRTQACARSRLPALRPHHHPVRRRHRAEVRRPPRGLSQEHRYAAPARRPRRGQ